MGRGLLILVSGLVVLVGIIQKTISDRLEFLPERTTDYHQEMDAQNIANSLMEYGIRELDKNQEWEDGFSSNNFMNAEASLEVFTYDDFISNNPDIPSDHSIKDWDQFTLLLVSKATTDRTEAITEVCVTKDSFSRYTYFTDYEPSDIHFYDDDVLDGPVHTNGTFHIAGEPVFKGFVSSPKDWEGHNSYTNNPQFEGGTDFNSKVKEMPDSDKLAQLKDHSKNGGLTFNSEIRVEFKVHGNDGLVEISVRQGKNKWQTPVTYHLEDYNGVISSSRKIYTKGTIKGQVTLHSEKEIEITGDLRYITDPRNSPDSTDLLGIVSEGDVIVDKDAHKAEGPHDDEDLEIHASIMALDKSFEVENYEHGDSRGTIKLYGGLQQKERGAVGTFNNDGISSGYSKDYSYDERLARMFPPFYPRESVYSQKYWKEKPVEFL